VFADLGFPDAAARQPGLRLAYALNQELEARKISQADAAQVMGLTQPNVSALRRYKLEGFSVERLMKPCDGARSGCRDRDSAKAPSAESA
jgi:predicted XRE-type DNA-binding protein